MKNLFFLLILIGIFSCNKPVEISEATVSGLADLPETAIKEPFSDNPDLVRVSFTNSEGQTETGDYLFGKRNGSWTVLDPNGLVRSITGYIDGQRQGTFIEIDDRGQLQTYGYYHNDKLHGEWVTYNRSRVKEERHYVDGVLEGLVSIYYDKGTIMEEGNYKNGVRHGVNKWYDQEGNVTIEYEYDNGELIKK